MKKIMLFAAAVVFSLTGNAQFGGFGGGFGGGFPGLGGDQSSQTQAEYSQKYTDINYAGGDGQAYHNLDIYIPKVEKESYPVVIHIYGSAWMSNSSKGAADINTICAALLKAGYAVVCPNHRSISDAKWPAQINDIKAVVRFVRANAAEYGFDTSFIATSGFSSGGHLSATTALSNGVKVAKRGAAEYDIEGAVGPYTEYSSAVNAFCDWSGPTDLLNMDCGNAMSMGGPGHSPEENLLGLAKEGNEDNFMLLSATGYIDSDDVAGYIFHGEKDNVVPCCVSELLYKEMQAKGLEVYLLTEPNGGHGMGMYSEENLNKMVSFMDAQRDNVKAKVIETLKLSPKEAKKAAKKAAKAAKKAQKQLKKSAKHAGKAVSAVVK